MSRKLAREAAMSLLYEREVAGELGEDTLQEMKDILKTEQFIEKHGSYVAQIQAAYENHVEDVDELISGFCREWKMARLGRVDLSILRLAVIELCYLDTPVKVVVNESVELAKKYSSEKSPSFINGVLASIIKKLGLSDK